MKIFLSTGWKYKTIIQTFLFFVHGVISNKFKQFTTKRNHWTLCLNCLIKFSVAAKLKICFFRKKFDVSVLSEFYVREPMVFGSFYSPFSGFSLNFLLSSVVFCEPSSLCLRMERTVFVPFVWKISIRRVYVIELLIFLLSFPAWVVWKTVQAPFECNAEEVSTDE